MEKAFEFIQELLIRIGLKEHLANQLEEVIKLMMIATVATVAASLLKLLFHFIKRTILKQINLGTGAKENLKKISSKVIGVITLAIIYQMLPMALDKGHILSWLLKIDVIIAIVFIINIINTLLTIGYNMLNRSNRYRQHPTKGFMQILQIAIYFIGTTVIVATILNKSIMGLFTGLGAFAAVLSFIFKDTITGFIAGIQLSYNDMVKPGDWIAVNGTMANGIVIDISLITVKVRNFDNTIVNVPTYSLMTTPFQNWRGMEESGGRRITLTYNIDTETVRFCTPDDLEKFGTLVKLPHNAQQLPITNLELYRMYLLKMLLANSQINTSLTIMVRYLQSGPNGVPIQLYCFSKNKDWVAYEGIQAAILEQAIASADKFDISIFQLAFKSDSSPA